MKLDEREAQYMILGDFLALSAYDSAYILLGNLADSAYTSLEDSSMLVYYNQLVHDAQNGNLFPPPENGVILGKTYLDTTYYASIAANSILLSGNYARNLLRYFNNDYVEEWPLLPSGGFDTRALMLNSSTAKKIDSTTNYGWIKVYPNPAKDVLNIDYNLQNLNLQPELIITDLTGRILYKNMMVLSQGIYQIDVGRWTMGSYVYNVKSSEKGVISGGVFVVAH